MYDRRKAKRIALNFPLSVELRQNEQSYAMTMDISVNGIKIQSKEALDIGSTIALQFPAELAGLTLLAKIVRRTEDYYGCEFFDVNENDRNLIDRSIWKIDMRNLAEQVKDESNEPSSEENSDGLSRIAVGDILDRISALEKEIVLLKQKI